MKGMLKKFIKAYDKPHRKEPIDVQSSLVQKEVADIQPSLPTRSISHYLGEDRSIIPSQISPPSTPISDPLNHLQCNMLENDHVAELVFRSRRRPNHRKTDTQWSVSSDMSELIPDFVKHSEPGDVNKPLPPIFTNQFLHRRRSSQDLTDMEIELNPSPPSRPSAADRKTKFRISSTSTDSSKTVVDPESQRRWSSAGKRIAHMFSMQSLKTHSLPPPPSTIATTTMSTTTSNRLWYHTVDRDLYEHMSWNETQRQEVILEFVRSERQYALTLYYCLTYYIIPIVDSVSQDKMTTAIIKVFESIRHFSVVHGGFAEELDQVYQKEAPLVRSISQVMLKHIWILQSYGIYLSSIHLCLKDIEKSTFLSTYIRDLHEKYPQHTLESLIMIPLQRLLRYLPLVKEILALTSPVSYEFKPLRQVKYSIMCIIDQLENFKAQSENEECMRDIIQRIYVPDDMEFEVAKPGRIFIGEWKEIDRDDIGNSFSQNKGVVKAERLFRRRSNNDAWIIVFDDVTLRCLRIDKLKRPNLEWVGTSSRRDVSDKFTNVYRLESIIGPTQQQSRARKSSLTMSLLSVVPINA